LPEDPGQPDRRGGEGVYRQVSIEFVTQSHRPRSTRRGLLGRVAADSGSSGSWGC